MQDTWSTCENSGVVENSEVVGKNTGGKWHTAAREILPLLTSVSAQLVLYCPGSIMMDAGAA